MIIRQTKFQVLAIFKKNYIYPVTGKYFLFLMLYFMLDGQILFRKGDFCEVNVSRMIFEGGILGGAHHFRGDPYLNSTIILFDDITHDCCSRVTVLLELLK